MLRPSFAALATWWLLPSLVFPIVLVCHAELLQTPYLRWSLQLEGSGRISSRGLRKGNAVVAHKGGSRIVVTADDGSLHIVQTTPQVRTLAVFEPEEMDGKYTECRSAPQIVYNQQEKDFIVYAVIDTEVAASNIPVDSEGMIETGTSENEASTTSSRVIAVDMDGTLKWTAKLTGRIVGDVLVGKTGMYVSHNLGNVGLLSVIMVDEETNSAVVVATLTETESRNGPFGPPALQGVSVGATEQPASRDVVLVAESWGEGYDEEQGGLFMLTTTEEFEYTGGKGNDSYQLQKISSWAYSSIVPPLVEGDSVFLGASGGRVAAWTGRERNDLSGIASGRADEIDPLWVYQVDTNPRNISQPLLNSPVLDSQGELLCMPGVRLDFYCLDASNGREAWVDYDGYSQIMARPQLWEASDASVVYVVESMDGRIRQHDLYSGERYWDYSCADLGHELCQDAVEAEFAIAPSGNVLYFGDIFGRITSLQIAAFETAAPTISPTSIATSSPTERPVSTTLATEKPTTILSAWTDTNEAGDSSSVFDTESEIADPDSLTSEQQAQQKGSKSTNVGLYVGAAIGGLCVLLVPFVIFALMRGNKSGKHEKNKEMLVEIIEDCPSGSDSPSDGSEDRDFDGSGTQTDSDAIEIEYLGSKPVPQTSRRRSQTKKKKRKKTALPETPQTLESIEELPEEAASPSNHHECAVMVCDQEEDEENGIEAVDLGDKSARMANSDFKSRHEIDSENSSSIENAGSPVSTGRVGVAAGSNHLELSVGVNSDLSPLHPEDEDDSGSDDDSPSDEEAPPPPPLPAQPPVAVATSSKKWSWGSLLQMAASHSTSDKMGASPPVHDKGPCDQKVVLRPLQNVEPSVNESIGEVESPQEAPAEVSHRAQTPPLSNLKKTHLTISDDSDRTTPPNAGNRTPSPLPLVPSEDSPSPPPPVVNTTTQSHTPFHSVQNKQYPQRIEDVEEEKKENEETFSRPQTPAQMYSPPSSPAPLSVRSSGSDSSPNSSSTSGASERSNPASPSSRSSRSANPRSPVLSPSNVSTDESLFTSATEDSAGKQADTSNLSPLSTHLFDREINRRTISEIRREETAGSLAHPDLTVNEKKTTTNDQVFRYLDDELPDDEVVTAPGFQYMAKHQEETKAGKYGRSVRSKKDSTAFKNNMRSESPITSMYNQLASMGQKQAEERKHCFRRRSKRGGKDDSPEREPEQQQQGKESDTWSSFLRELAEAEKQFFSPSNKTSSLLKLSDSQDSEDSEVARINNIL